MIIYIEFYFRNSLIPVNSVNLLSGLATEIERTFQQQVLVNTSVRDEVFVISIHKSTPGHRKIITTIIKYLVFLSTKLTDTAKRGLVYKHLCD